MLNWASNQPSPLIRKTEFKQIVTDAFQSDLERRIFRQYLKLGRNAEKKMSWIYTTKIGAYGGEEYVKLSPEDIDQLDLIMNEICQLLTSFQSLNDHLTTKFSTVSPLQSQARFTLGDMI